VPRSTIERYALPRVDRLPRAGYTPPRAAAPLWLYAVSRTVRKTGQNGRKNGDIVAGLRVEKKTKI
jgi:hypothetical protein